MAAAASNSLIERLILKHAKKFVQNLELSVNLGAGEVVIRNIVLKDGYGVFRAMEEFLHENNIDVWGCNGTPIIFPTGLEIEAGSIKEARVQIPVPNPFNGENWQIVVDGITGRIRTLPQSRRAELLRQAKKKGIEEAMKRAEKAMKSSSVVGLPDRHSRMSFSSNDVDSMTEDDDGEANNNNNNNNNAPQDGAQVWTEVLTGSWARVQKRIDRYFREHLEISMRSAEVLMHFGESPFPGYEDARWEAKVGECRLDLGVGQKVLPEKLLKAIMNAPCHQPLQPPAGRKVIVEEIVVVGFHNVDVAIRPGAGKPAVADLHFPQECFTLHLHKKQWEEKDPTKRNGIERIHCDLPDSFSVNLRLQHMELRACLVHMLHQIFDGVACAVPDYADWLTVPWEGGWQRSGALTAPKEDQDALAIEYRELLLAQTQNPWVLDGDGNTNDLATATSAPSKPSGHFAWLFGNTCCAMKPSGTGLETTGDVALQAGRLSWLELSQTTEWLAYWKQRSSKPDVAQASAPHLEITGADSRSRLLTEESNASSREDSRGWAKHDATPQTGAPQDTWRCWPFRRFEVTLAFGSSFEVSLGVSHEQDNIMKLTFPPGMSMAMVRDLPAEWEIWASLPGIAIATEDVTWLTLQGLSATIGWGRRHMLPAKVRAKVPEHVPTVTRIAKVKVCPLSLFMSPAIVRQLLPLLAELPHVGAWPELWYLWGEWGYMQRPHGYIIESVQLARMHIDISTQDADAVEAPLKATKSFKVQSQSANIQVNVRALSIHSNGQVIYVDKAWQPWWNVRVEIGDTSVTAIAFHRPVQLVSYSNVWFSTSRARHNAGSNAATSSRSPDGLGQDVPSVKMGVHAQEAKVQVSPKVIQCSRMLAVAYETACKQVLFPAAKRMQEAAVLLQNYTADYQVSLRWMWPAQLTIQCEELDHLEIIVQNSVASCLRIKPSFRLIAVLKNPDTDQTQPLVRVEMDRAGVEVEVLDDSQSQSWEPLLEPWGFKLLAELYVPPESRLTVKLTSDVRPSTLYSVKQAVSFVPSKLPSTANKSNGTTATQSQTQASYSKVVSGTSDVIPEPSGPSTEGALEPLHLTISSTVVKVGKELVQAWSPQVIALVGGRWREVEMETGPSITALNLCPLPVTATVRTLPQDISEVVLKLQSIFRGRKMRNQKNPNECLDWRKNQTDRSMLTVDKNQSSPKSGPGSTRSPGGSVPKAKVAAKLKSAGINVLSMLVLGPARPHPLLVEETQRLHLNFNGVQRVLGTGKDYAVDDQVEPGKQPKQKNGGGGSFLRNLVACGTSNKRSGRMFGKNLTWSPSAPPSAVNRFESLATNGAEVEATDSALMNVCRNGHTKLIPTVGSENVQTAYICEVISPSVNDRMLVIHSPVRIFNYTDHTLSVGFFCGEDLLPVDDGLPQTCTILANLLGSSQPVFPLVYGIAAPQATNACAKDGAWQLGSKSMASVPVHLRNSDGGVNLRLRLPSTKHWKCRSIRTADRENGEIIFCQLPDSEDSVRLLFKRTRRSTSSIVANTGHLFSCWEIVILPTFSLASIHPMPLEVQVMVGADTCNVDLERGKIKNMYAWGSQLGERKPLCIRVRATGTSSWSAPVKVQYDRFHQKEREVPLDEQLKLPSHGETASTEVTVRHADVALILPPVWLCDKTGLGLKATDKKGREFPKAGAYALLDTSMGDNYLTLQIGSSSSDVIQAAMSPSIQSNAARRVVLTTAELQRKQDPSEYTMYPLAIETTTLGNMLGTLRCPPMQVLTVRPGIMIKSDVPLLLRQPGFEGYETTIPVDELTPVWFRYSGGHQCLVQMKPVNALSDWSGKVICEPGAAGVYSMILAPSGQIPSQESYSSTVAPERGPLWFLRGSADPPTTPVASQTPRTTLKRSALKALSIEVADNEEAVLVVTVSAKKHALTVANNASIVEVVGIETDGPGVPVKYAPPPVATLRQANQLPKQGSGLKMKAVDSNKEKDLMPGHSFTCPYGEDVAVGWFEPFGKGVQTNRLRLWLSFKDSPIVCGPIEADIYSAWSYYFLMPDALDTEEMVVINFSQGHRCYYVSIDTEPFAIKHGCQALCGCCGSFIAPESIKAIHRIGSFSCSKCKAIISMESTGSSDNLDALSKLSLGGNAGRMMSQSLGVGMFGAGVTSKDLNPFARLLSLKDLWGLMVLDVGIDINCVGISVVSKRMECEVAYIVVDSVSLGVKAPEGILITHIYHMSVLDVRCDRMFEKVGKTPAIFASTPLEDASQPAFNLTVVRPFVTAQAICLKEVKAKFGAQFEVALDTEVLNALLDFREECIVALGNPLELIKYTRPANIMEEDGQKCIAEMQEVLQRHGSAHETSLGERVPMILQLEALEVDTIEAKVWATLQLSRMAFVPASAARLIQVLTLSDQVELTGALVKITPVAHEPRRGSAAEVGRALLMSYLPQLVAIGARLLGASNLHKFATSVPYAISHVMLKSSDVVLSAMTLGHGEDVKSTTRRALGIRHQKKGSTDPVWTGEARLREPRLIFANARITLYNALHAELLTRLGHDMLRRTLNVFIVAEDPVLALIVRTDALIGCSFKTWLTADERRPANTNGKDKSLHAPSYDQTLLGPWPWNKVSGLEALPDGRLELSLKSNGKGGEAKILWPSKDCRVVFKERAELRLACNIVSRMVRSTDVTSFSV